MNESKSPAQSGPLVTRLINSHYTTLDGLRGMAILLVMVYHFGLAYHDIHSANPLMQFAQFGWLGVDLFFVLSGFLITGILIETRQSPNYFPSFLMRRFLRIWPLYYLSLAVFFVLAPLLVHPLPEQLSTMHDKQWWFWLYGANWLFAREGGFEQTPGGYYWSLAVEEQFYLIWPLVVWRLSNLSLLRVSMGLFVVSLVTRLVLLGQGFSESSVYVMTITHLDSVVVGASISVCLRSQELSTRVRRLMPYVAAAAFAGLVAVRLHDRSGLFWERAMASYGYSFAALLFGSVLVYALNAKPGSLTVRFLGTRLLVASGKFSYALYLLHVPVAVAMEKVLLPRVEPLLGYGLAFAAYIVATFGVSFGLAVLSWNLFEKHVLSLKKYFAY